MDDFNELQTRLIEEKQSLLPYLLAKLKNEDYHGVADAAMDLRDIACQLEILEKVIQK